MSFTRHQPWLDDADDIGPMAGGIPEEGILQSEEFQLSCHIVDNRSLDLRSLPRPHQ